MIIGIINFLIAVVTLIISIIGYPGILILMLLESCGIPIPSEIIMPFSGFLVSSGQLSFWIVILIGAIGNLFGSLLAYFVGLKGGRPLIEKFGKYILISKHDLDLADRWFSRHGKLTVFFGRLLPIIRTYISFPAGIAKMNLGQFSFYTFIGALPWCALFTWLGVKMDDNWELIHTALQKFDLLIALIIIALLAAFYFWRKKNFRQ